jgi:hypothetical protein
LPVTAPATFFAAPATLSIKPERSCDAMHECLPQTAGGQTTASSDRPQPSTLDRSRPTPCATAVG